MNEQLPVLIPPVGEDGTATMMRGSKMRIYPSAAQAKTMDLWRRRCMQLWNLLLQLEQAAYSGENTRTQLGWRSIWAQVVEDSHAEAVKVAREGKKYRDGTLRKEPSGKEVPPLDGEVLAKIRHQTTRDSAVTALLKRLREVKVQAERDKDALLSMPQEEWDAGFSLQAAFERAFPGQAIDQPFSEETLYEVWRAMGKERRAEIKEHRKNGLHADGVRKLTDDHNALEKTVKALFRAREDKLFVWEHELQKIMARLKQVPRTHWIDDLPSHASQSVVKDLIKALQAMLRERKKRVAGTGGRDTGFPKFKKNRYAAGSVYFANTQLKFEAKRGRAGDPDAVRDVFARVKLPNGVGWMECRMPRHVNAAHAYAQATLMGGRIWRQGEDWYLSCQWKMPKPAPLPVTGRTAAIKIAAAIPVTIVDNRGQTREHTMPPINKALLAAHAAAGRTQSRALEARKAKTKKREAYAKKRHARKLERGIAARPPGRARIKLSPGFYAAAARLAKLEADDANARDAWLHEITTQIVRDFDVIAVQRMEVAKLMKKPAPPEEKEEQVKAPWQGKRRSLKAARVMMRRTAMARIQTTLKYKATDLRGEAAYEEISPLDVTAGACSGCGVLKPEWKMARAKGREIMRCQEALPGGKTCNTVLTYTRNSARVIGKELAARLKQRAG